MANATLIIAFLAGVLSFLSPCVLPLIPAFFSYMSGVSNLEEKQRKAQAIIFANSVFFVIGFSVVFALLGVLINSLLAGIGYDLKVWAGRIGGLVIILFGLYVVGILKLGFLDAEHKLHPRKFRSSYLTSFVFGATFAAGWTPCVGAILGSIFTLAITQPGSAFYMLLAYSLGLGLPFLLVGLFTRQFYALISKSQAFLRYFNIATGILLIIIGVLVFTGNLARIASFAPVQSLVELG